WILDNQVRIKFCAAIPNAPNSTRAETESIFYLLLIIPNNTLVNIHIDNVSTIQILQNLPYFQNTLIKLTNWDIVHNINYLLNHQNISITLHKVKAHSNNVLHTNANQLAKRSTDKKPIEINSNYFLPPSFFSWKKFTITFKLCKFIKNIFLIQNINNLIQLKSIQNLPLFNI
ncbi:36521_t:CDS:1, partial [Gigaspora margarita]